jgi:hypothetical protein
MDRREPKTYELIAETAAELEELSAFCRNAGLELLLVVVYAVDKPAAAPTASAA